MLCLVVLLQAVRIAIPSTAVAFVVAIKDTSLTLVIGAFDLMSAIMAAVADTLWRPYALEGYPAVAAVYLLICAGLSALPERWRRRTPSFSS